MRKAAWTLSVFFFIVFFSSCSNMFGAYDNPFDSKNKISVTGVTLDKKEASLNPADTVQLSAIIAPANATNKKLTWVSSSEEVAAVSDTGLVTAISAGKTDITVTTEDSLFSASCSITVISNTKFTVTFDSQGGSTIDPVTVLDGSLVTKPENPSRKDYSFEGWYCEKEAITVWDFTKDTVSADITLFAKWKKTSFTVMFDSQGGSTVESLIAALGSFIPQPVSPSRTGYGFDGWYCEKECLTAWDFANGTVSADITLYARWIEGAYTVSYILNGGTNDVSNPSNYTVLTDDITLKNPSRNGYAFTGWFDNAAFSGSEVTGISKGSSGDKVLYAKWTIVVYTISYTLNDGSNDASNPVTYTVETPLITFADPSRSGYVFMGWFDNASFSGNAVITITAGSTGNRALYARWLTEYTINYTLNGGINDPLNPAYYTDDNTGITLMNPARAGYTFDGWYGNSGFSGGKITSIPAGSTGNKNLFAKWVLIVYTITYNLDGGTNAAGNPASYTVESPEIVLSSPTKAGYSFFNWYDNPSFTGAAVTSIPAGSTGNKEVFAKWVIVVTLNGVTQVNGASGTSDTSKLDLSFDVDPVTLTVDNITLTGAAKGALSGTGTTRSLAVSNITVANGESIEVSIANPSGYILSGSPKTVIVYKAVIGTAYNGGKIAYVFTPKDPGYVEGETHGLIGSITRLSSSLSWALSAYKNTLVGETGTALGTGKSNTERIVAQNGLGSYAAKICSEYSNDLYSDWFLPSKDELDCMYLNRGAFAGSVLPGVYWSSSEYTKSEAYICPEGMYSTQPKDVGYGVWAAQYF